MKLNYRKTILIGLAFLSISAFWQLYEAVIPLMLSETFGLKETYTGVIMAVDNILALFMLPFFGVLSDKTHTRFGKRTPFIIMGTMLAVIFMQLIPASDNSENFFLFFIALVGMLIAMGIYRAPAVALMPDLTPKSLRSEANAIINIMGSLGIVATLILISVLVPKDGKPDYSILFITVSALMIVSVMILAATVNEATVIDKKIKTVKTIKTIKVKKAVKSKEVVKTETAESSIGTINSESLVDSEEIANEKEIGGDVKKSLLFLLLSVFFWFAAFNAVTTAFSRYAVNVLGLKGGSYAGALLVAMIIATLGYVPSGIVSMHLGRKKTIIIGIAIMTVSYFIATWFDTYTPFIYVIFAFTGFGWAAINVNAYPMVVGMSRGFDIGKYTGLYYTFSTAAQIITPIVSGFLLENISYRTLFPYAGVLSFISLLTMLHVKHGDAVPKKSSSMLKNFNVD